MQSRKLYTEVLEERSLFAVAVGTAYQAGATLFVVGTENADSVQFQYSRTNNRLTVSVNNKAFMFQASSLSHIDGDLKGGNDSWNALLTGFRVNQIVRGGSGNDAISTGEGNDVIYGGSGNDSLMPWAGADTVYCGDGNDWVAINSGDGSTFGYPGDVAYGEGGVDTMIGGSNDRLFGGDGNDVLTASGSGAFGGTYMDGGDGDDRFYANQGQYRAVDVIYGGAGNDWLVTYDLDSQRRIHENLPRNNSIERIG